jgi:Concanavalin A-like lectin/glucanases superfamily/PASTA domain
VSIFTDSSGNGLVVTTIGTVNQDTANPAVGNGDAQFPGNGDGLSIPITVGGPLDISAGDYTIEFWYYANNPLPNGLSVTRMLQSGPSNTMHFDYFTSGAARCTIPGQGPLSSVANVVPNAWNHLAVVVKGPNCTVYSNGVGAGPVTIGGSRAFAETILYVGDSTDIFYYVGNIDELRFSKGIARYTADFAPQTTPFDTDSYTSLLLHFDTTIIIPDLTGDTLAAATAALVGLGLTVGTVGYIPNSALTGTVVDQDPVGGTIVSSSIPVDFDLSLGGAPPNCIFDEAIYGAYFGGQLNLVEFTYMPGRTPFEEGARNLIINRYKQQPTDSRQRGVDFTKFSVPGETLVSVVVSGISAQGHDQQTLDITPLVVSGILIDPVTGLKFAYMVSGGQDGIEYTVQFTCVTNIQGVALEEVFSINFMVEDAFP